MFLRLKRVEITVTGSAKRQNLHNIYQREVPVHLTFQQAAKGSHQFWMKFPAEKIEKRQILVIRTEPVAQLANLLRRVNAMHDSH